MNSEMQTAADPAAQSNPTLDIHEAAAHAKCGMETLRRMASAGQVPATKIGRRWVFSARLLQAWIDTRCETTARRSGDLNGGSALAVRLQNLRLQKLAQRETTPPARSRRGQS